MTTSRLLKLCAGVVIAAVGAVLLVNSVWHFRNPFPQIARGEVRELRSSPPQQEIVAGHQGAVSNLRAGTAPKEDIRAEHPARGEAQRTTNPSKLKKPVPVVRPPGNEPVLQAVAPPPPVATVMKPIGYVEKANGQVEAVVSEGDQVYVVHEGEVFAEKYKVTKVSQFAVEVVEVNASHSPLPPPDATNFAAQRAPATPTQLPAARPRVKLDDAVGRQSGNLEAAARREPTSDSKPLGYVETSNGQVQFIVADGEFIRLVPGGPEVAATSNPPMGVASPVEVARVHAEEAPPTGRPETTPAGRPEKVAHPPLPPGSVFQLVTLRSDSPPSDSMVGEEARPAASLEPSASVVPDHVAGGEEKIAGPEKLETGAGSPDSRPETLRTIGYVEWASGQVEGIVDEGNEIFLVKEGEVFADRYRALKVFPTSMVVAEEAPRNGSPPSAETGRELDRQLTAGLGVPTGLSPPGDVNPMTPLAQDEQVSAAALGPEPRPPNDARPPASRASPAPRARHNLLASTKARAPSMEATGPPPASLPITLTSLGYVEKANGEVQAIVVQDDQIYLIQQGDFFAHRYKALSVSASAVVAVEVSPQEAANQISPDASTKGQLSSAKPVDVTLHPPSAAVQAVTLLPEVESTGKALTGSAAGLLEYQPGVGFHFRFSMNATPNLPH